jgi:hypothetical protein
VIEPRKSFRKSLFSKGFQDIMDSAQFEAAANAALLEMQVGIPTAPDGNAAAANNYRLEGARKVIAILMNLAAPDPEPPKTLPGNLDHHVLQK